jgi:hypothetical protein
VISPESFDNEDTTLKRLSAVSIYAIAMGYLESAVVIYLRQTAFGNSIQVFPMRFLEPRLGGIELAREAATIIMLLTVGYLAGKNRFQQLMFFIYSFAIWDIFYYMFLKLLTGWPGSFGDFDVLFLIPIIWISPVICPILISLLLTSASAILILFAGKSKDLKIPPSGAAAFLIGAATVFYSFTERIFLILFRQGPKGIGNYTPTSFDWLSFSIGFLLLCFSAIKTVVDCYHKMTSYHITERKAMR